MDGVCQPIIFLQDDSLSPPNPLSVVSSPFLSWLGEIPQRRVQSSTQKIRLQLLIFWVFSWGAPLSGFTIQLIHSFFWYCCTPVAQYRDFLFYSQLEVEKALVFYWEKGRGIDNVVWNGGGCLTPFNQFSVSYPLKLQRCTRCCQLMGLLMVCGIDTGGSWFYSLKT